MKKVCLFVIWIAMNFISASAFAASSVSPEQAQSVMEKYSEYIFFTGRVPPLYSHLVIGMEVGNCPAQSEGSHIRVYTEPAQVETVRYLIAQKIEGVPTCVMSIQDARND